MSFVRKYIGDRPFYRKLFLLVLPIIIQQGITHFVNLLDNIMVGQLGTYAISAVSIVNQLLFVFNLAIFGGLGGPSIFGAQFSGVSDWKGTRNTFRYKFLFSLLMSAIAVAVLLLFGEPLIRIFLENENNTAGQIEETLQLAREYLEIILIGLLPFSIVQSYASSLREQGETLMPMLGGVVAIVLNLSLNYVLIYGKLGFPALGVKGAAIATVISRFAELAFVTIITHVRHGRYHFIEGAFRSFRIPKDLVRRIILTSLPLLMNEVLWAVAEVMISRNYSIRGLSVVAAVNITNTVWNFFCIIMFSMGSAISILVGQRLGARDREGAIDTNRKLIFMSFLIHLVIGGLLVAASSFIPLLYNVEQEVRDLATCFMIVCGCLLPFSALYHASYFTIRTGGKTLITFILDSVYTAVVSATLSYVLCRYTGLSILAIFWIVRLADNLKLLIILPLVHSGFWANCVISDVSQKDEISS